MLVANSQSKGSDHNTGRLSSIPNWQENTTLLVGDSMLRGIREDGLSRRRLVKVRCFPGAIINDFYYYLVPLMERKPKNVIIHAGTNDVPLKSSDEIIAELLQLKNWLRQKYNVEVTISCPIIRNDDDDYKKRVEEVNNGLQKLNIDLITHDNITDECLDTEGHFPGLHLTKQGTGRFAINIISFNRKY